jgi:hypothetical protein
MDGPPPAPVVLAYGVGVDSTALMIEKVARGEKIDLVLTADTGVEKACDLCESRRHPSVDGCARDPSRDRLVPAQTLQALAALLRPPGDVPYEG